MFLSLSRHPLEMSREALSPLGPLQGRGGHYRGQHPLGWWGLEHLTRNGQALLPHLGEDPPALRCKEGQEVINRRRGELHWLMRPLGGERDHDFMEGQVEVIAQSSDPLLHCFCDTNLEVPATSGCLGLLLSCGQVLVGI